jgi:hypothetical protein
MSRLSHVAARALLASLLVSCGSDDDATVDTTAAPAPAEPVATEPRRDVPESYPDLRRICESGAGFADIAAYDATSTGPHPVASFIELDGGALINNDFDLPREWLVSGSEVEMAELVACGVLREDRTPNGIACVIDRMDDGVVTKVTLDLVDVVYDIEIFEAASAASLGSFSVAGSMTECPTGLVTTIEDGQSSYMNGYDLEFDSAAVTESFEVYVAP